ncbi:hypothetical protein [Streptomyces sp. CBMA29]|uniref:hypothetical protein n=1 Tax=Streptomyces sp. CBMA29 TaxID=1896314 RepID=UPI001661FB2D|nr:hypothetical protein [Streptomyces sp. CBMA29]MBD0734110.1 hypothetical protein [Streptomyces sp. CBMA29]
MTLQRDDLYRELDKIQDTLNLCLLNLGRQSESWAALHCNPTVMYSPLHGRVGAAMNDVNALRFQIDTVFSELTAETEATDV